jgi:hypothetical protein
VAGFVLDAGTSVLCPHGGQGRASTASTRVLLGRLGALRLPDQVLLAGCPFVLGTVASPCVRVQWLGPSARVRAEGQPVLLSTTTALCLAATGAPQGTGTLLGHQTRVRAS